MVTEDAIRRLNIPLTEEQFQTLNKYIPRGMKKYLFYYIVESLIELLEKDGAKVISEVILKELKVEDILKLDGGPHG